MRSASIEPYDWIGLAPAQNKPMPEMNGTGHTTPLKPASSDSAVSNPVLLEQLPYLM